MFCYEFLRALTKFGNFQLKKEFENCFKPREKVELSPIMSMEQIVENIMSKEHPVVRGVEKGPHFWLTQLAIARLCIKIFDRFHCCNSIIFRCQSLYRKRS